VESSSPGSSSPPLLTAAELAHTHLEFARKMLQAGDVRKAVKYLEQAIELSPSEETLYTLAQIELERTDQHNKALEHLKQAVAINQQHTPSWLLLANYWGVRGQEDKQRRCLEKILGYDPKNRDARDAVELLLARR
jgi:tetratricopeptide (TPR) repeat protein